MKKEAYILRFNQVDSHGQLFTKGSVKFSNPVKIFKDFDHSKLIGKTNVFEVETGLKANFNDDHVGLYPAIGVKNIKQEGNMILECEIFAVGLSISPNIDPEIKPIK